LSRALEARKAQLLADAATSRTNKEKVLAVYKGQLQKALTSLQISSSFARSAIREGSNELQLLHMHSTMMTRLQRLAERPTTTLFVSPDQCCESPQLSFVADDQSAILSALGSFGCVSAPSNAYGPACTVTGAVIDSCATSGMVPEVPCLQPTTVVLQAFDRANVRCTSGGAEIIASILPIASTPVTPPATCPTTTFADDYAIKSLEYHVKDAGDGSYTISFVPKEPGRYSLAIQVNRCDIAQAAYEFAAVSVPTTIELVAHKTGPNVVLLSASDCYELAYKAAVEHGTTWNGACIADRALYAGTHYWEVRIVEDGGGANHITIGISNNDSFHEPCKRNPFLAPGCVGYYSGGVRGLVQAAAPSFTVDDRIGVLLAFSGYGKPVFLSFVLNSIKVYECTVPYDNYYPAFSVHCERDRVAIVRGAAIPACFIYQPNSD
jgi:hypothetical protein